MANWIVGAVVIAFACGHASSPARGSEASAHGSAESSVQPSDAVLATPGDAVPANEPIIPTFDGKILSSVENEPKELSISIGLPSDAKGIVTVHWTGAFTRDGSVLKDTDFTLTQVTGNMARAVVKAPKLPSETVRLFAPGRAH